MYVAPVLAWGDRVASWLVRERDLAVMRSGEVETAEERLTAAGLTRTYLATKAPYRDDEGRIAGVVGISRDITDRKRAEDRVRHLNRLLHSIRAVKQLAERKTDEATSSAYR